MGVQLTNEMIEGAKNSEKTTGVPASITLAQIMLESGGSNEGGLSTLAYKYNNLFGVKASKNWVGMKTPPMQTTEYTSSGQPYKTFAEFRAYGSIADSIADHDNVITQQRYVQYYIGATSLEDYAKALQKGGYATDTNYANQLMNAINTYNLTQYDSGDYHYDGSVWGNNIVDVYEIQPSNKKENDSFDFGIIGTVLKFLCIGGIGVISIFFLFKTIGIEVPKVGV